MNVTNILSAVLIYGLRIVHGKLIKTLIQEAFLVINLSYVVKYEYYSAFTGHKTCSDIRPILALPVLEYTCIAINMVYN